MTKPLIHVLFNEPAATALRRALLARSRTDQVACLLDDLSVGPIADDDIAARAGWMESELLLEGWQTTVATVPQFLQATLATGVMPVAWFSRHDAQGYAGFLWWLSKLRDAPCQVMDTTNLLDHAGKVAISPSALSASAMQNLFGTQRGVDAELRRQYAAIWSRLKAENAAFRVVEQSGEIVSKPITCFDPALIAACSQSWRPMASIIGEVLSGFLNQGLSQASDAILHGRIRALVALSIFEWRGDLPVIRACELRLTVPAASS